MSGGLLERVCQAHFSQRCYRESLLDSDEVLFVALKILRVLVYSAVLAHVTIALIVSLRERRVPHRLYLLEKNRKLEWATSRQNPIEYWLSVVLQFLLWALISWSGIDSIIRSQRRP
jgi:hypothetical protein